MPGDDAVQRVLFLNAGVTVFSTTQGLYVDELERGRWTFEPWASEFAVANGSELWGWSSNVVESAFSHVYYSGNGGRTWSEFDLKPHRGGNSYACSFINERQSAPLLLMTSGQLLRPRPNVDASRWDRVGTPAPVARSGPDDLTGVQHDGIVYIGDRSRAKTQAAHVFMSKDAGMTWSRSDVASATLQAFACHERRCYVLARSAGQPDRILSAATGSNEWLPFCVLDEATLGKVLPGQRAPFIGVSILPTARGLYISGNDSENSWAGVLLLTPDGTVERLGGRYGDGRTSTLTEEPSGSVWLAAKGAYRWSGTHWELMWSRKMVKD
jgi:hypothetical protein